MKYFLLLNLLIFCLPSKKQTAQPERDYYLTSTEKTRCAVLKHDDNRYANCNFEKGDVPTVLSKKELSLIEKLIEEKVAQFNGENIKTGMEGWNIKSPEKYFKQIIAAKNQKGEKVVWVNCCCEVSKDEWKKRIEVVDDGGQCYFRLNINLTTHIITHFGTNGIA